VVCKFLQIRFIAHKRKRCLQDAPVDLTKMTIMMAMIHTVLVLSEELADVAETEAEMRALMSHMNALQETLRNEEVCT
jgi:hypothetical protein